MMVVGGGLAERVYVWLCCGEWDIGRDQRYRVLLEVAGQARLWRLWAGLYSLALSWELRFISVCKYFVLPALLRVGPRVPGCSPAAAHVPKLLSEFCSVAIACIVAASTGGERGMRPWSVYITYLSLLSTFNSRLPPLSGGERGVRATQPHQV